jgi:hypothetical protein
MSEESYAKLVHKLGSLHTLLRECAEEGLYQGEHTIAYSAGGVAKTLHVYIDGTNIEMSETPGSVGLSFSAGISSGD